MNSITQINLNIVLLEKIRNKQEKRELTNVEALRARLEIKEKIEKILETKEFLL
jgi:hypothetical protein